MAAHLSHRDMTDPEREKVESTAREERRARGTWSSLTVATLVLFLGSFVCGLVLFGVPAQLLMGNGAPQEIQDAALFGPAFITAVIGGPWSLCYYVRGSWRVRRELIDDLEYGRVEVIQGSVEDAVIVDSAGGALWLLDVGDEVLVLDADCLDSHEEDVFPGRSMRLVRCKHSGLVLDFDAAGPRFSASGRWEAKELSRDGRWESARLEGQISDVLERECVAA